MNDKSKIIINIGLRGLTLGTRMLMVIFLARYLGPADLGLYGLFIVTIAFSMYPLGFEFYTFSSRAIVKVKKYEMRQILKNQLCFHGAVYVIALPLLCIIFYYGILPQEYAVLFFMLVVLEHLNQEVMRLLVALQNQLAASFALFIRQGFWGIVVISIMYFVPKCRNLESILIAWCTGGALSLIFSACKIWNETNSQLKIVKSVDWRWIGKGLKIALPLFFASLSANLISTVDRYWYEYLNGLDALGAYVLYGSVATSILAFMDAGIFSIIYPKLLLNYVEKNFTGFKGNVKIMLHQTAAVATVFIIFCTVFGRWFYSLFDNKIYLADIHIFYIIIVSTFVQCLGYVAHYALYAIEKDRHIVIANIGSIILFVIITLNLVKYSPKNAIPISIFFASIASLIYKWSFYLRSQIFARSEI